MGRTRNNVTHMLHFYLNVTQTRYGGTLSETVWSRGPASKMI